MKDYDYIRSNEFDAIFKAIINLQNISVAALHTQWNLSFKKAKLLYEEWLRFSDEVFIHNVLYELSFENEPPTISRIMGEFHISYLFAEKIFQMYMEVC